MEGELQLHDEEKLVSDAVGWLADGGPIEQIGPVGVSGLIGQDHATPWALGMAIWPFPPEASTLAKLAVLGYQPLTEESAGKIWLWRRAGTGTQLLVAEAGSTPWTRVRLLHAYAAANTAACRRLADIPLDAAPSDPLVDEATQWWLAEAGFAPLHAVAGIMAGCPGVWCFSSGWALDLFMGRPTRLHHDVDLVVDRADQFAVRTHLEAIGFHFVTPLDNRLEPWSPHMRLELPRHQLHAHRQNDFIDILLTDFPAGFWQYRREPRIVRSPDRMFRTTEQGWRYLAPELVLLFKSKNTGRNPRPQDLHDFTTVVPRLDAEARAWLYWALMVTDAQHPWLNNLGSGRI